MKKLIITTLILTSIILVGCTTQKTTLSTSELFEKKKECASYENEIKKYLEDQYNYRDEFGSNISYLQEIFYSPKLNTCLYKFSNMFAGINRSENREIIIDFFGKNIVRDKTTSCYENTNGSQKRCFGFSIKEESENNAIMDKKLAELKGQQ